VVLAWHLVLIIEQHETVEKSLLKQGFGVPAMPDP
jgi:hypothetical protein